MKKTFSISEAISFGWKTFKSNWKFWVVALLLSIGIKSAPGFNYARNVNSNRQMPNYSNLQGPVDYSGTRLEVSEQSGKELLNFNNLKSDVLGATIGTEDFSNSMFGGLVGPLIIVLLLTILSLPLFMLVGLVSVIFKMGYINLTLDAARDKQVYYRTLLNQVSLKKAIRFVTAQALVYLIVIIGLILLIIPGIIFALKYLFVPFVIVDEDVKIGESLKRSSQLTKGNRTKLLGLIIVFGLISLLGVFALGYGIIVSVIVISLAQAYVYNSLLEESAPESSEVGTPEPVINPTEGILAPSQMDTPSFEEEVAPQPLS